MQQEKDEIDDRVLFEKMTSIARGTGDQHAAIIASSFDGYYFGDEEFTGAIDTGFKANMDALIRDEYSESGIQTFGKDKIAFGILKAGPAYIRIDSFSDYRDDIRSGTDNHYLNPSNE